MDMLGNVVSLYLQMVFFCIDRVDKPVDGLDYLIFRQTQRRIIDQQESSKNVTIPPPCHELGDGKLYFPSAAMTGLTRLVGTTKKTLSIKMVVSAKVILFIFVRLYFYFKHNFSDFTFIYIYTLKD